MKTGYLKKIATLAVLAPALLIGTLPASAQSYGRDDDHNRDRQVDRRDNERDMRGRDFDHDRDGYRSGYYYNNAEPAGYVAYAPAYTSDYYVQDNGIGPGKGAAIGAVSGAVLGALFGGGKGAVIGGAAGATVGAVAGEAAQNSRYSHY